MSVSCRNRTKSYVKTEFLATTMGHTRSGIMVNEVVRGYGKK